MMKRWKTHAIYLMLLAVSTGYALHAESQRRVEAAENKELLSSLRKFADCCVTMN